MDNRRAFTLIELLVVIAIISILAAVLFPVLVQAKAKAKQAVCTSNFKQIGTAFELYLADSDDRLPDRRDLKASLPGGYKPWTSWPASDPRCAWAAVVLEPYAKTADIFRCPAISGSVLDSVIQVREAVTSGAPSVFTNLWMWRFDRPDDPVPLDDLWGKTPDAAVTDLQAANNPTVGFPQGVSDVEMAVDPYFPQTIGSVPANLKGLSVHFGGRNRLFLDWHARFLRDPRTH